MVYTIDATERLLLQLGIHIGRGEDLKLVPSGRDEDLKLVPVQRCLLNPP